MTPTFGEFLASASKHVDAVICFGGELGDDAKAAAIKELDRLAAALARYAGDVTLPCELDPAGPPAASARAMDARLALQHAADSTHRAAQATAVSPASIAHPAVEHLSAAADLLAAGRDVLQTHFATGPAGARQQATHWAPVIASPPVTTALLTELAGYARRIAPWTAQLSLAGAPDSAVPPLACVALHTASRWLWAAGSAMTTALRQHPPPAQDRRLLHAVPANIPPPRREPHGGETVAELCAGAAITAERLRHAAPILASQSRWPPTATVTSWRRDALAAAILGHSSELLLRLLATQAQHLAISPALAADLRLAADASGQAWPAWQAAAHGLDIAKTGNSEAISPITAELGDLVLWIGRLAYGRPGWTPARGHASLLRDPADLAPAPADITAVLAAVHHAADAVTRIVPQDREAVRQAAAERRLHVRTRLLPESYDVPYHYAPIPPSLLDELLIPYDTAIEAANRAIAALDSLAITIDSPTRALAADRPRKPAAEPRPDRRRRAQQQTDVDVIDPAVPLPERGQVEQALHALKISEPGMLGRAAAIDSATQSLIDQATAKASGLAKLSNALRREPGQRQPGQPATLASKDLPHPLSLSKPAGHVGGSAAPSAASRTTPRRTISWG